GQVESAQHPHCSTQWLPSAARPSCRIQLRIRQNRVPQRSHLNGRKHLLQSIEDFSSRRPDKIARQFVSGFCSQVHTDPEESGRLSIGSQYWTSSLPFGNAILDEMLTKYFP